MLIIRIPLVITFFLLVAALGTLACLFRPFHPDNTRLFAHFYSRYGLKLLGLKLSIDTTSIQKHLNQHKTAVYVANHQDNLDLFVTGAAVQKRTVTIGKKSLKYLPLFGQLYWLAGNVFIDRKNTNKSSETLNSSTLALQEEDTSIWVFAEGTRNRGKNMLPFKSGAFRMAIEAQVPIIPICVSSYVNHMNLNRLNAGKVSIKILPEMNTQGLSASDCKSLQEECWNRMSKEIAQLDRETYK